MYNPFVPFTDAVLRQALQEGAYLFVIQRFNWPLVEKGKGFMVTVYKDTDGA
ncbi:hypothetical protein ACFOET_08705 [Parapedobacter deserti]|uniref:Uncharacterized protein n=1 Tax=Parapedobacter deserti TaxID=1912957 RepID=A0ABV7JI19_9SPHI